MHTNTIYSKTMYIYGSILPMIIQLPMLIQLII